MAWRAGEREGEGKKDLKNRVAAVAVSCEKKKGRGKNAPNFTGRVKREERARQREEKEEEWRNAALKKRGNRTHKKKKTPTTKCKISRRSTKARACVACERAWCMRACVRTYVYAHVCMSLTFFSLFFSPFFGVARSSFAREAHTCSHTRFSQLFARTLLVLLYFARRVMDAEKAHIKLSRWFIVCIARRRRVTRVGVRVYERRGSM